MRLSKNDMRYERGCLAKETGLKLELEESGEWRKPRFTLYQEDENGDHVKWLIEDECTTREMYLVLKAAREIYKAAINLHSSASTTREK